MFILEHLSSTRKKVFVIFDKDLFSVKFALRRVK